MITRRRALTLLGGASIAPALSAFGQDAVLSAQAAEQPSLADLAAQKGVRFGSCINQRQLKNPAYTELVKRECAVIVAEREHKMRLIRAEPDTWDFEPGDDITRFAKDSQLGLRGHTLLWNYPRWIPDWINNLEFRDALEAEQFLTEHVGKVASRHSPTVYSWDVVNESFNDKTGELRESVFSNAMGWDVIDHCFHVAKENAPNAELAYNDYMSWDDKSINHRAGVLKLLERLLKNNVPIDALGIQAHIMLDRNNPFTTQKQRIWREFLDEVAAMGLDILFTEVDANDRLHTSDMETRDTEIAAYTKDYLDIALSYPNTKDILLWGMVDTFSWLQQFRDEGEPAARPLPYDMNYEPKPMREAMAAAFRAAPTR